jgi:hypothetical protein
METLKIYNALALLTDTAKLVLRDMHNPATLAANLDYLAQAIASAEKILLQHPIPINQ